MSDPPHTNHRIKRVHENRHLFAPHLGSLLRVPGKQTLRHSLAGSRLRARP